MRGGFWILAVVVASSACGGGSNPMAPPPPPTPNPTPSPAPQPLPNPSPSPSPAPGPTVLRTATIRGSNGHSASGTARILRDGSSYVLELGDDFRIDSGNNDVMLTRQPSSRTSSDLNLGNMKSLTGRQTYSLPNDGSAYAHVLLWCRPFNVPIGVGELQ